MDISVIVPVLNEEKNIEKLLLNLKKNIFSKFEILIIYDYSKDPTVSVVKKYIKKNKSRNIKLIKNETNSKKGVMNAIKTGFLIARGRAVVVVMADLSDDTKQIDEMYSLIRSGYDIVCGSRYMKKGKKIGGPILKTFLSFVVGFTLYYIKKYPTHDATNAYKMYNRTKLNKIEIKSTEGFEYSLEILVKAFKRGYRITEIPTVWKDRAEGKSNFQLIGWLPQYIRWYIYAFLPIK